MGAQTEALTKLSKSQKKKKSAQKKKLAKRNAREEEEQAAARIEERHRDENDARVVEQVYEIGMRTRDFQMLNIRGKLLIHPTQSFFDALTTLRRNMTRDTYPSQVSHARRLFHIGVDNFTWSLAMGAACLEGDAEGNPADEEENSRQSKVDKLEQKGRKQIFKDYSVGVVGLTIWYPIFAICMAAGDKLACIALRDTCGLLRTCYGLFRNDITRPEQFVFDARDPSCIKQLDWVARRVEVPPSPPQTPPREFASETTPTNPDALLPNDPFRSPTVLAKRWSDYDDDDESIGSPMSLPITPETSAPGSEVPALDLDGSTNTSPAKDSPRRPPTTVIAIPTLTTTAPWFSTVKTVLPVARLSLFTFEDFPRTNRTSSSRPMKLQSSSHKHVPGPSGTVRVRARFEHWVRESAEKNLKTKLSLGLSSAAKKVIDAQAESAVFNRVTALAGINIGVVNYIGEPDILGTGVGLCVEDIRDIVTGRFRPERERASEDDLRVWSEYWSKDDKDVRVMLVPSTEGWICRYLGDLRP